MKEARTTLGDRFSAAFLICVASFITALIIWGFIGLFVGRAGEIFALPFKVVVYSTACFTVLAFLSPDKSLDCIGWVWKQIEKIVRALKNENGAW
jgi:hypothetical protein